MLVIFCIVAHFHTVCYCNTIRTVLFCLHLAQCSKTSRHNPVCRQMGLKKQAPPQSGSSGGKTGSRLLRGPLPARFALYSRSNLDLIYSYLSSTGQPTTMYIRHTDFRPALAPKLVLNL